MYAKHNLGAIKYAVLGVKEFRIEDTQADCKEDFCPSKAGLPSVNEQLPQLRR